MKENKKTPDIRFKGFTDDWEQRKLGKISDKVINKNQNATVKEVFTNSAEFGIVSQRDFFEKDIANTENINGYYIVEPNDFVYNPRISTTAPFGPIKRNKLGRIGAMSPLYYVFRAHDINLDYLECYFQTTCWHAFMRFNGNSGARSDRFAITDKIFNGMPIFMSQDVEEQKLIGNYFSKLDNLITLHQRECDQLKELKKTMLKKMFPRDDSNIPEVRFAGFTDDWEQRKFSDLVTIERGGSPRPIDKYITNDKNGLNWIKIGDAPEQGNYITQTAEKIKPEGLAKTREVHSGDLILSNSMSFGRPYIMAIDGCIHDGWLAIRDTEKNFDLKFLCTLLGTDNMLNQYKSMAAGSTVNNLNKELVGGTKVLLPIMNEQVQIGQYFSQIDNLITLHQRL